MRSSQPHVLALPVLFLLAGSPAVRAADAAAPGAAPAPPTANAEIVVMPAGWATRIPPQGAVNVPGIVGELAPGQGFQVALMAKGDNAEDLLKDRRLTLRIRTGSGKVEKRELAPVAVRRIKTAGADRVMEALEKAGVDPQHKDAIERGSAVDVLAIYDVPWTAPAVSTIETVHLEGSAAATGRPWPPLTPHDLTLRPWADWQQSPALTGAAALDKAMRGFHEVPRPGDLLPMLKGATRTRSIEQPKTLAFFVDAFSTHPAARKSATASLASLDPEVRRALLVVLRLTGDDITPLLAGLPEDERTSLAAVRPLPDARQLKPFADPVSEQAVDAMSIAMDQCWGGWMATGDASYLRPLVALLEHAADYPAFEAWKAKGAAEGLDAHVANGLAYQVAGRSLASWARTDPRVTDWLLYWQGDAALPQAVRDELKKLQTNPALATPKPAPKAQKAPSNKRS